MLLIGEDIMKGVVLKLSIDMSILCHRNSQLIGQRYRTSPIIPHTKELHVHLFSSALCGKKILP